jgi:hypothetical protein
MTPADQGLQHAAVQGAEVPSVRSNLKTGGSDVGEGRVHVVALCGVAAEDHRIR